VSRNGTKASAILKAASEFGLTAKGWEKEPHELSELRLPFIAFWNFNHYVVVEGFRKRRVYLNDPGAGRRIVTDGEFNEAFTGVALTFERNAAFQAMGARESVFNLIRPRMANTGLVLGYLVLVTVALLIPSLVVPILNKVFVDNVIVGGMGGWLMPLLFAMALAGGLQALLSALQLSSIFRLDTKLAIRMSSRLFWHILHLPMDFFVQRWANEIGGRMELSESVSFFLSWELGQAAANLLMMAVCGLVLTEFDKVLGSIVIGMALLNVPITKWAARLRQTGYRKLQQERSKLMAVAASGLQMIETLKATCGEASFFSRWAGHQAKAINLDQKLETTSQLVDAIPPFLLALTLALVLGIGGYRVIDGYLSMGLLVAFYAMTSTFNGPLNQLVSFAGKLQESEAQLLRLEDVMRYPIDQEAGRKESGPAIHTWRLDGHLELRDVTFGYSRLEAPLVSGLSLVVKPGQRVALVGASGSGKSTVAKLIVGLFQPWSGEILFDGKRRDEIPREVLSNSIGMVDQDIFLFQGSIRENLTLWDETIPEAILLRAGNDAQIHDDISARPHGYDFVVDEGGRNFSGGQRQRLEIARALVTNPRILVLDEATAALDPRVEHQVDDSLRRRGCTTVIIAHRLSTVRDCDEIIVLDRGVAVERGTHEEMLRADGPYRRLIQAL
jgi:NHLM bacteriocin system ABC transporter peptidase/ATP-binding protein